ICVALGMIAMNRMIRLSDRTSTRLSNLEKRVGEYRESAPEAKEEILRLRSELETLRADSVRAKQLSAESALQLGRDPRSFLSVEQAAELFEHYLQRDLLLEAAPLVREYDELLDRLDLGTLRAMYRVY